MAFGFIGDIGKGIGNVAKGVGKVVTTPLGIVPKALGIGASGGAGPFPGVNFKSTSQQETNPMVRAYQNQLKAYGSQAPQQLKSEVMPQMQQANLSPAYMQQFNLMRQQAQANASRENSEQQSALERRFAQHAGLQSGAFIKQQQIAADNAARRTEEAMRGVDTQQLGAQAQLEDMMRQQQFQGEQAAMGRNLQRDLVNQDSQFKRDVFGLDSQAKLAQLDLAFKEADHQRMLDQYANALDAYTAKANKKKGLVSDLLGDIFGEV